MLGCPREAKMKMMNEKIRENIEIALKRLAKEEAKLELEERKKKEKGG